VFALYGIDVTSPSSSQAKARVPAPHLTLPTVDGSRVVSMRSFRGRRPVALVFGSISCPFFGPQAAELERLYRTYGDRVEFLVVYQREAHPEEFDEVDFGDEQVPARAPQTFGERCQVAAAACRRLGLTMTTLVDTMDDAASGPLSTLPVRLMLVDREGYIVYASTVGPIGFRASQLERAIGAVESTAESMETASLRAAAPVPIRPASGAAE
jgi:hypothetical protein